MGREVGVRENVEQSALPPREHLRHARNRIGQERPVPHDAQTSGAFGDQHVAVGQPRDGPGDIEAVGHGHRAEIVIGRPQHFLGGGLARSGSSEPLLVLAGPLSRQIAGVNARVDDLRVDLTTRIDDLRADLTTQIGSVNARIDRIETRLDGLDERLRDVELAFGKVDQRLLTIERIILPAPEQPDG